MDGPATDYHSRLNFALAPAKTSQFLQMTFALCNLALIHFNLEDLFKVKLSSNMLG